MAGCASTRSGAVRIPKNGRIVATLTTSAKEAASIRASSSKNWRRRAGLIRLQSSKTSGQSGFRGFIPKIYRTAPRLPVIRKIIARPP